MSQNSDTSASDVEPGLINIVPLSRLQEEQENVPVLVPSSPASLLANSPVVSVTVKSPKAGAKSTNKKTTKASASSSISIPSPPQLILPTRRNQPTKRKASADKDPDLNFTITIRPLAVPPPPKKLKRISKLKSKTGEAQGMDIRRFMIKKEVQKVKSKKGDDDVINTMPAQPPSQLPPAPASAVSLPPPDQQGIEVNNTSDANMDNEDSVNSSVSAEPEPPTRFAPNPSSQEMRVATSKIEVVYGYPKYDSQGTPPLAWDIPINSQPLVQSEEVHEESGLVIDRTWSEAVSQDDSEVQTDLEGTTEVTTTITSRQDEVEKLDKAVNIDISNVTTGVTKDDSKVKQDPIIPPAPPRNLNRNLSFTQIDEVTSTDPKVRSRKNSCSSESSRKSTKERGTKENLDLALEQKNWSIVFKILQANLKMFHQTSDSTLLPPPQILSSIIQNCLMRNEERVTKNSKALAVEFMKNFIECDKMKEMRRMEILLESLEIIKLDGEDSNNCYWTVISKLFEEMLIEAQSKLADRVAFPILERFYFLVNECYQKYLKTRIKMRLPIVAKIFKGGLQADALYNGKDFTFENFENLIGHLFNLQNYHDEFNVCLNWVNLFISHYCKYNTGPEVIANMVAAFKRVSYCKSGDYGVSILRKLQAKSFIHNFVVENVHTEFPELGLAQHNNASQVEVLTQLSNSKSVIVHDTYEILTSSPPAKRRKTGDPLETGGPKRPKGESFLHRGCAAKGTTNYRKVPPEKLKAEFIKMKKEGTGNINIVDNTQDTPLYDAAYHGRVDVLDMIDELGLYTPNAEPGPLNANLLAKNTLSETILHSAVINPDVEAAIKLRFVKKLFQMCNGEHQKIFKLLNSRDKDEQTPIDRSESCSEIRDFLNANTPDIQEVSFIFAGQALLDSSVTKFKKNVGLQRLIALWRHIQENME